MSLIGLANAAAAQIKEDKVEKPPFPVRTASMPILKRDSSAMDSSGPLQHIASQQPVQAKCVDLNFELIINHIFSELIGDFF
mmetsp:Transcript_23380/g.34300  ORF Transcript_23380/g.34300 Transcript_23380/m.34300 type:complete len:82 (+) Transcript_23380:115-360(+)